VSKLTFLRTLWISPRADRGPAVVLRILCARAAFPLSMLSLLVGKLESFERLIVGPPAFSSVATLNLVAFGLARSYAEGGMVNIDLNDVKELCSTHP
jgi:hypothetical protein